jgi:hypothetical protein
MTYFRVEIYEGCSLMLSRTFENLGDAKEYRKTIRASDTRIIDVDENGAALPFRQN